MQRRRRQARYGSSGELDVFGATRYFDDDGLGLAKLAAGPVTVRAAPQDLMIQVKVTPDMKHAEESYSSTTQELAGPKAKSNLATFFCSLVSRAASFCENAPAASHDEELPQIPPPASSLPACVDIITAAASCGQDLGVVVGDRRLQGVRVVSGGDEARWVVRCGGHALEEEHGAQEKIIDDAASSDHGHQLVEGAEDGDDRGWDSDSSSDLFELDLENAYTHQVDRRTILSVASPGPRLASISE